MPVLPDTPETRAAKAQHAGEWSEWLGTLPEKAKAAMREYGVLNTENRPVIVDLVRPKERPLGLGPKLSLNAAQRLIDADRTPDRKWARWILENAGGGDSGRKQSDVYMKLMHSNFISTNTNAPRGQRPPMTPAQAEREWQRNLPDFTELLTSADQDIVSDLHVFGFYRDWPGRENIYANVAKAMTDYMGIYAYLVQMNKEVEHEGGVAVQPTEPSQVKTYSEMSTVVEKVKRYFAAKKARADIRLATWKNRDTIYNDDYITAIAPLTYATAVKYGFDSWAWANRKKFEEVVMASGPARGSDWERYLRGNNVFVILQFNVPTPAKLVRRTGEFRQATFTNLAVSLTAGADANPDELVVWDEENNQSQKISDIKRAILEEPGRTDTQEVGLPFKRPKTIKTEQEAQETVRHLDLCLREVVEWARQFDISKLQTKVFGYEPQD